jgi:hypothetical protein
MAHPTISYDRLYVDRRCGGQPRYSMGPPKDALMRIPDDLLHTTVFLGGKDSDKQLHYRATAFIVGMPSERADFGWPCLVTARHNVVKAMQAYGNVYVRVNIEDGSALDIEINESWSYPKSESCDIAIVPFPEMFGINGEVLPIPHSWFVTKDIIQTRGIGPGDELIVMGLFSSHIGKERNLPIVRSGNIASMPLEPLIDPKTEKPYDAYLAEVRSIGGLSGSPVFIQLNPNMRVIPLDHDRQGQSYYLLGLIRGHWKRDVEIDFDDEDFSGNELGQLNTGVAIVTPAVELLPIFESEPFVLYAQTMDKKYNMEIASDQVEDSAIESEGSEFDIFRDLTQKIVQVPKSEIDEKRKKE